MLPVKKLYVKERIINHTRQVVTWWTLCKMLLRWAISDLFIAEIRIKYDLVEIVFIDNNFIRGRIMSTIVIEGSKNKKNNRNG